jgi:drug/metabolite transporter (DMT)-like permease
MRRTLIALALALATANPTAAQSTAAQPKPKCPIARVTLLGAAVGFGTGAIIAFPVPGVGQNVFEDTGDATAPWVTLIGLTIVGAVIGNALARRNCATTSPSVVPPYVLLSETEVNDSLRPSGWKPPTVKVNGCGRPFRSLRCRPRRV